MPTEPTGTMIATQPPTPHPPKSIGFLCYWLPLFVYAGGIILLSSLSTPKIHLDALTQTYLSFSGDFFSKLNDKLTHAVEYSLLGLLAYRAIRYSWGKQLGPFAALITIIAVALFGCTDELHQGFTPLRSTEALDLMADIGGGFIGVMLWEWGRTLPTIRLLEEQLPVKLQLIRGLATSKVKTEAQAPSLPDAPLKD